MSAPDPLFRALTMEEVVAVTGRSKRTIERWVKDQRLVRYRDYSTWPPSWVFSEQQVLDVEQERHAAAEENRNRIRRRLGRPRRKGDTA